MHIFVIYFQLTDLSNVPDLLFSLSVLLFPRVVSLQHFYAEPRAAKEILGWSATTNLPEDLKERFEEYVKIGRDKKEIKFELDDKILESLKVPVAA